MTDIRIISILLLLMLPWSGPALAGEAVLVVHRDNPISSLELTEVRSIFLGKKVFWDDGNAIEVLLQESGETHRNFSQNILGKSPRQLSMYWKRVLFSGEGLPPGKSLATRRCWKQSPPIPRPSAISTTALTTTALNPFPSSERNKVETPRFRSP